MSKYMKPGILFKATGENYYVPNAPSGVDTAFFMNKIIIIIYTAVFMYSLNLTVKDICILINSKLLCKDLNYYLFQSWGFY